MLSSDTTDARALHLTARVSGEYLTLSARVVALADDGTPRNLSSDEYATDPMYGIAVTMQADRSDGGRSYAWKFGMRSDETASVAQLVATLATLRAADRRMTAEYARYGAAPTVGAWLARVMVALRVPAVIGTNSGWYSDGQYQTVASGDAAGRVDGMLAHYYRTGEGPDWR